MNLIFLLMQVLGFLALAAACLKVLEGGPSSVGPAFSPAARLVLLLLIFAALYSALEALAWRQPVRPGESIMIGIWGAFSVWRTFQSTWSSFFQRPDMFNLHRRPKV